MPKEQVSPIMALARGVRVDGDNVVISVRGGNEAARTLCGELVLLLDQDADPIARHLASKVADHWRNECMRLRTILGEPLTDDQLDDLVIDESGLPTSHLEFARAIERAHGIGARASNAASATYSPANAATFAAHCKAPNVGAKAPT